MDIPTIDQLEDLALGRLSALKTAKVTLASTLFDVAQSVGVGTHDLVVSRKNATRLRDALRKYCTDVLDPALEVNKETGHVEALLQRHGTEKRRLEATIEAEASAHFHAGQEKEKKRKTDIE